MPELPRCPKCGSALSDDAPAGLCPKCLVEAGFESAGEPVPSAGGNDPAVQPTMKSPAATGAGFKPPPPEELVPLFPQLEILELLGKGGMGAVYKARQRGLDRLVAVKILPPEIGHDASFAERFIREARALARLSHPHIVAVYDFGQTIVASPEVRRGSPTPPNSGTEGLPEQPDVGETPGRPSSSVGDRPQQGLFYIVMEHVDGVNLRQTIEAGGLTSQQALTIVPQICEALQFAHDEGIVHRDIKPENILIDKKGRVKIADFGLAKLLGQNAADHSLTGTQQVMGTLRYMAPEQMQGSREVDHRADIYSLGVVFYELLTGEVPMGKFAPPSKKVQVDVRLDEIVLRALEQEPELRYQHASEVQTDVEMIQNEAAPESKRVEVALDQTAATYLVVCGALMLLLGVAGGVMGFIGLGVAWMVGSLRPEAVPKMTNVLGFMGMFVLGSLVGEGGWCIIRRRRYNRALLASLLSLLLGLLMFGVKQDVLTILGFVPGVVALYFLLQPEIKAAFQARQQPKATTTAVATPSAVDLKAIQAVLGTQAKAVTIAGAVGTLLPLLLMIVVAIMSRLRPPGPPIDLLWILLTLPIALLINLGGEKMYRLHSYGWAKAASILAILPIYLAWFIGLPAGAVALVALKRRDVRAAFQNYRAAPEEVSSLHRSVLIFALSVTVVAAAIAGLIVAPQIFHGRSDATAQMTFKVAGSHVEVTLNGKKLAVDDSGRVEMQLRPGEYEVVTLKNGQPVVRSGEVFHPGERKSVDEPNADAIRITGPLALSYGPGSRGPNVADFKAIQGRWIIVSQEKGGEPFTEQQRGQWIEFDNDLLRSDVPETPRSQAFFAESRFTMNAAADPGQIDILVISAKGIYRFERDTLTLSIADAGDPRPTEFVSRPGSSVTLTVCRRAKQSELPERRQDDPPAN